MAAESVYGVDTSATSRVHYGRTVTGAVLVAEAMFRRLSSERGSLPSDRSYGWSITRWLGSEWTEQRRKSTPGLIANELRKDDRVEPATLQVEIEETTDDHGGVSLIITIFAFTTEGERFELVFAASAATTQLLRITNV